MAEAGGPANQAGIYFQNTIAALYLGRMLDLRPRRARDRVVHVRVEAPESVDDIVVRMADGTRRFIQAKLTLVKDSDAWKTLWRNFALQLKAPGMSVDDRLTLVLGTASPLADDLRAMAERASTAVDATEWLTRLTGSQKQIVDSIAGVLGTDEDAQTSVWRIMLRTDVEVIAEGAVERDHAPLWMPPGSIESDRMLAVLRDLVGGASRVRGSFDAAKLRSQLKELHGISISDPEEWGAATYRDIILRRAVIEVPGTGMAHPVSRSFLWQRATRYDRARQPDFDDETPGFSFGARPDEVDLSAFPDAGLEHVVVVAGPGFGKSVLALALAEKAAVAGRLPVIVPIPDLSRLDLEVSEYLASQVNKEFDIAVDWQAAAEGGLLVLLFDGLDEVATPRRTIILDRIKRFSFRYPSVPWLLTVRDAAALAAPTNAILVELEPLNDSEIERFVALYRPDVPGLSDRLRRRMEARPDLQRLVRIPLFLAILLSTAEEGSELPKSRTDLLETYLELLFRPEEFKRGEQDSVDPSLLRPIAETVALDALEREEMGVNRKLLQDAVRAQLVLGASVEPVIERLVKCGVIRRSRLGRYTFPFPIVQEYLAACHILEHRLDEVPARLAMAIKRPWAQALQFVLERHPKPGPLTSELLAEEDDAFHTQLRLVARSVANGMWVDAPTRQEIARRLATIWPRTSWRMAERIGELIAEAFSKPLIPEIREQLGDPWALNRRSGSIVVSIGDPTLTREVLEELLSRDSSDSYPHKLLNLQELQEAVDALGDAALAIYVELVRSSAADEEEHEALAVLIRHLDPRHISDEARLDVAVDETLPLLVRLASFTLGHAPIDERAVPLIYAAAYSNGWLARTLAAEAIWKAADPLLLWSSILSRSDVPTDKLHDIVNYFSPRGTPGDFTAVISTLARDQAIPIDIRQKLMVFAARYGDANAMNTLVNEIETLPFEITTAVLSIFGYHRSRTLAEDAARALRNASFTVDQRVRLFSYAVQGMTMLPEMDWFDSGGIHPAPPHPGMNSFRSLLEEWACHNGYGLLQALRIDEDLVRIGSDAALGRLPDRIEAVLFEEGIDLQNHEHAATVSAAIRALQEHHKLLGIAFLEQVVERCSWNGATAAAQMIAAHASRDALDSLMSIYMRSSPRDFKAFLLDLLESLAGRLGLRMRIVDGRLEASA